MFYVKVESSTSLSFHFWGTSSAPMEPKLKCLQWWTGHDHEPSKTSGVYKHFIQSFRPSHSSSLVIIVAWQAETLCLECHLWPSHGPAQGCFHLMPHTQSPRSWRWTGRIGLGAIFSQHFREKLHQVAKKLTECNYDTGNQELLAVKMLAFVVSSYQAFCS